jgi:hypothetical protein
MDHEKMNQAILGKPKSLPLILNYVLMAINILTAMGSASYIYYTHVANVELIDEHPEPAIAYFFLRKEFMLIPILLVAYMIYKEFKVASFKKRVKKNLWVLAGIYIYCIFIGLVPFIFLY